MGWFWGWFTNEVHKKVLRGSCNGVFLGVVPKKGSQISFIKVLKL